MPVTTESLVFEFISSRRLESWLHAGSTLEAFASSGWEGWTGSYFREFQRQDKKGPENILPSTEEVVVHNFGHLERRGHEMHRVRLEADATIAEATKAKGPAERAEMLVTVITVELSRRVRTEPNTRKKLTRYDSREFSDRN
jgi:hypothetical protein